MCDCEKPDYDEEGEELWSDNIVLTESKTNCCECCHPINAGEQYRHIEGCWDGNWSAYQMCLSCSAVSDSFTKEPDNCHCLGGLYEELINTEILFTLKDDDGRTIEDEQGNRTWLTEETWLSVVNQDPLKCKIVSG